MADATHPRPVALVTGAARGIGAATVRALVDAGWSVIATDRCSDYDNVAYPMATYDDLNAVVAYDPQNVIGAVIDVCDSDSIERIVGATVAAFGWLDAVVAAAGLMIGAERGWELDEDLFSLVIDVNLTGVQRTAAATIPTIIATAAPGAGRFVAIASGAVGSGRPGIGAYNAAKAGVVGLVKSMAAELGSLGVTANCVAPGSTSTTILDASAEVYGLSSSDEFAQHQVVGRLLDPDEVAAAVVWLCDPQRSGVTGTVLSVDGGMSL